MASFSQLHQSNYICFIFRLILLFSRSISLDNFFFSFIRIKDGLNEARLCVNVPREAYRQKLLEVERKKMEEIAAAEAALQAELEKNAPQKGKKSPAKKKK